MSKRISVGSVCDQMAGLARMHRLKSLTMWLKMAANEAYLNCLEMEASLNDRIGVWDWDMVNDLTFTNATGGAFFGKCPEEAASGRKVAAYTSLIHPHDVAHFSAALDRSIQSGSSFFSEYRVVVGHAVRWIRADGNCAIDAAGRRIKMLGSMIDITHEKMALGH